MLDFENTIMKLTFRFEITENNDATVDGTIVWPIHMGSFTLGFDAGNKQERKTRRNVELATTFRELMAGECLGDGGQPKSRSARLYPVTGHIGVDELVDQYLMLSEVDQTKSGKEVFKDTLTFTTTVNGGISPSVKLTRVSPSSVAINGNLSVKRTDIHEVTVEFSLPEKKGVTTPPPGLKIESIPGLDIRFVQGHDGTPPTILMNGP